MTAIKIIGTGHYVPDHVVTNDDFAKIMDTNDEWIYTRTGMKERHLSQGEPTWYMALSAAKEALDKAAIDKDDIDLIIVSSVTPDYLTPSMSCIVQRELGIKECMSIDINAACTGFVYGLDMARRYLSTGDVKTALVIGSENLTKMMDYKDRTTCILFGDGAGAAVVTADQGLYASYLSADGTGAKYMVARSFEPDNAFMPLNRQKYDDGLPESNSHYLAMDGREVYKFAIKALPFAVNKAIEKTDIKVEDIDLFIPHQANIRIIETAAERLGVSMDKFYVNLDRYANTSSASIPIALNEAFRCGKIKQGDKICLVGFGSGLTYGALIFEYK